MSVAYVECAVESWLDNDANSNLLLQVTAGVPALSRIVLAENSGYTEPKEYVYRAVMSGLDCKRLTWAGVTPPMYECEVFD